MSDRRPFAFPGTRAQYVPDRLWALDHIALDVEIDLERRLVAGTATLTMTAIAAGRWIVLDAVELEIASVRRGDTALAYEYDGDRLRVDLGDSVEAGAAVDIAISYQTSPRRGLYFVGPDEHYPDKPRQAWSQGQDDDSRYWFPCPDTPSQKATSEIIATVAAGLAVLSNGELVSDTERDGKRRVHYKLDHPHSVYLITLVVGELEVLRTRALSEIDVSYWVPPQRAGDAERTLARTPEMIELFSERFGVTYPYRSYAQVFVADFIFGGMENTTATTLTDTVMLDDRAAIDFNVDRLVAHELAHQWFGDLVTCRSWGEAWLNEGFATYSEYLWREHAEDADAAFIELDAWGQAYFDEDRSRYRRRMVTRMYHAPLDVFDAHLYQKGGRVLHMLRQILGDRGFFDSLRRYLETHRRGSVETRDLSRAVEAATGRNLEWFFDQWVTRGAGHPELEVEVAWDAERRLASVTVAQTQDTSGDTPLFRLPLRVRFCSGAGDIDASFEISEARHTFYAALPEAPAAAIIDPGKPTLAAWTVKKPRAMWLHELARAEAGADRIDAARQLARIGGAEVTRALATSLRGDRFWGVQVAAAAALGEIRSTAARDALIAALEAGLESPHTRRAAVAALGEFRGDEAAFAAVAARAAGDESYRVEAEALLAAGKLRCKGSADLILGALDRESFMDIIRQQGYLGLAELGDEAHAEVLLGGTRYGAPTFGRRGAARGLAILARGRRDELGRRARERLEELLDDPDFRVQGGAIEALRALGDAGATAALQRLADRDLDGRLRRRSLEVIRDLAEGRAVSEREEALREQLDTMRRQLTALADQVNKLETEVADVRKGAQ